MTASFSFEQLSDFIIFKFPFRESWIREFDLEQWTYNDRLSYHECLAIKDILIEKLENQQPIKLKSELYECATERSWKNCPSILIDLQLQPEEMKISLKLSERSGTFSIFDLEDIINKLKEIHLILSNISTFVKINIDSFAIHEYEFD